MSICFYSTFNNQLRPDFYHCMWSFKTFSGRWYSTWTEKWQ